MNGIKEAQVKLIVQGGLQFLLTNNNMDIIDVGNSENTVDVEHLCITK